MWYIDWFNEFVNIDENNIDLCIIFWYFEINFLIVILINILLDGILEVDCIIRDGVFGYFFGFFELFVGDSIFID